MIDQEREKDRVPEWSWKRKGAASLHALVRSLLCEENADHTACYERNGSHVIVHILNERSQDFTFPASLQSCYVAISRHLLLVVDQGRSPYLLVEVGSMRVTLH